jgi:hypothetical protein
MVHVLVLPGQLLLTPLAQMNCRLLNEDQG